jgi:2-oxoglutarate dehydrogenase E2 component (dihydrolipoamide succinyltransferase)
MAVELKIPEAGESITEVQIGRWLKSEGDFVRQDESLVELETDKASMELPAPAAGRLTKVTKKTGDAAHVG